MADPDYVIVGAGSAGCVLANRLTEDPSTRVLLIEAGGKDRSPNIKIPAAFANQFHTDLDWDFSTEPEPGVNERSLFIPRGKSLGGSGSMNAMLYVRGRPLDYDLWREQGAPGWGWDDVLPYFLRSEDNVRGASEFHGSGGEMRISEQRSPRPLDRRLLDAGGRDRDPAHRRLQRARAGRRLDVPGLPEGRAPLEHRRRLPAPGDEAPEPRGGHGRHRPRASSSTATAPSAFVTGASAAATTTARTAGEVILCAGAIGSPQILLLSGIGAADELREAGRRAAPRAARALGATSRTTRT